MSQGLLPLARFDCPQLRRIPGAIDDPNDDAGSNLGLFIAKECAGMSHECRPDTQALREAFRTGRFTHGAIHEAAPHRLGVGLFGHAEEVCVPRPDSGSQAADFRGGPLLLDGV